MIAGGIIVSYSYGEQWMNKSVKPLSKMTREDLWQLFPIILSGYDPDWKQYYEEEKALLEKSFGNRLIRIEHIGSTAVEGLIAKPTVNILLEAAPSASPDEVRRTAERCGYTVMSKKNVPKYRSTCAKATLRRALRIKFSSCISVIPATGTKSSSAIFSGGLRPAPG